MLKYECRMQNAGVRRSREIFLLLIAYFLLLIVLLTGICFPAMASSLQDEHHEHSEMNDLYDREFHNELWRLPDPQKFIYAHLRWVLGAAVFLWIVFLTTNTPGMMRRKRRGPR